MSTHLHPPSEGAPGGVLAHQGATVCFIHDRRWWALLRGGASAPPARWDGWGGLASTAKDRGGYMPLHNESCLREAAGSGLPTNNTRRVDLWGCAI